MLDAHVEVPRISTPVTKEEEEDQRPTAPTTATTTTTRNPSPTNNKTDTPRTTTATTTTRTNMSCLPRTLEWARIAQFPHVHKVIGIDEAGRGPLAGPVVTAAVWAPTDLKGIIDSKQITKEEERERLYEELMQLQEPHIEWAVAVMDAATIDDINILQATLEGMRLCATALVSIDDENTTISSSLLGLAVPIHPTASIQHQGCYVVRSTNASTRTSSRQSPSKGRRPNPTTSPPNGSTTSPYYALVDGNRVPSHMPCPAESVIKGDGKEYMIAAASIVAKVTRDRLMNDYDKVYPEFNLKQHKGYPTADHRKAVATWGASPIHRRTFAPLKHMTFDEHGRVVVATTTTTVQKERKG
jgi:ribonuclease HII